MQFLCIIFIFLSAIHLIEARSRPAVDICNRQPTINGLCVTTTLGIYYDAETQRCKYMGCSSSKKLFASLEDCEKICNSKRHSRRRAQISKNLN